MTNKKILLVNFSETWGGGENWHFLTAKELLRREFDTTLLIKEGSVLHERCIEDEVPFESINISKANLLFPIDNRKLSLFFNKNLIDTVIINGSTELKSTAKLAQKQHVRKVIYRRGIPVPIKTSRQNKKLFRSAVTDIISNSLITQNAISEIIEYAELPTHIIPNGIPVPDALLHDQVSDKPTIGILSRLSKEKGINFAITAMRSIVKIKPDAKLMIAGKGKHKNRLRERVTQLGLESNVEFLGFVEDTDSFLKNCNLLLMPSVWEGFGFALLEGMKHGLPCVGFKKTSAEEIIKDGITGYLAPHKDTNTLAELTLKVLNDEKLQKRLGKAGFDHLEENYSIEKVTDQLIQVIEG